MNNKGFLRILEALIAIIIIFMFTYYIMPKNTEKSDVEGEKIKLLQQTILDEISHNEGFRNCILGRGSEGPIVWDDCKIEITNYMGGLNTRYQDVNIVKCSLVDTNCESCEVSSNNVYVSEIFISGENNNQKVTICIGR